MIAVFIHNVLSNFAYLPHPTSPYKGEDIPLLCKEGIGEVDNKSKSANIYDVLYRNPIEDNLYAYAKNNPISYIDLFGLDSISFLLGVGGNATYTDSTIPFAPHNKYSGIESGSAVEIGVENNIFAIKTYRYSTVFAESQASDRPVIGFSLNPFSEASATVLVGNRSDVMGSAHGVLINPPLNPGIGGFIMESKAYGVSISGSLSPINISGISANAKTTISDVSMISFEVSSKFEEHWNKGLDFIENAFQQFNEQFLGMRESE